MRGEVCVGNKIKLQIIAWKRFNPYGLPSTAEKWKNDLKLEKRSHRKESGTERRITTNQNLKPSIYADKIMLFIRKISFLSSALVKDWDILPQMAQEAWIGKKILRK